MHYVCLELCDGFDNGSYQFVISVRFEVHGPALFLADEQLGYFEDLEMLRSKRHRHLEDARYVAHAESVACEKASEYLAPARIAEGSKYDWQALIFTSE